MRGVVKVVWVVGVVAGVVVGSVGCKEDPRTVVENAVFDKLECEEIARPSTLSRVREMVDEPSLDHAAALAFNPQDLATLVSVAGPEVEGTVVVVRNVLDISPKTKALVRHGFDDFAFACDDGEVLDCTAGSETVSVSCDEHGDADAVDVILDKCTIAGTVVDGAVTLVKERDGVRAVFDAFSINETKVITGDARLAVDDDCGCGFGASVTTKDGDGLRVVDFGGPKSGLECGEELRVNTLAFSDDGDDVVNVALSGSQVTTEETYDVDTDVSFDGSCACPLPGSRVSVATPDSGRVTIDYAKGDAKTCATATVTLDEDLLGREEAQAALSSLMTAMCAR
jgi:hypothetical protein